MAQVISIAALPHITGWYQRLKKPSWTPPTWLFGPAWGVMYTLMGYSGWRVIHQAGAGRRAAQLWGLQLGLNFAWQPLFFNRHALKVALGDIIALDLAIVATALEFRKFDKNAAAMLLPYLAWTTFATALNYNIMANNPPQGGALERRKAAEYNASEMVKAGKVEDGISFADKVKEGAKDK